MAKPSDTKKLALQAIVLTMDKLKSNVENTKDNDDLKTNVAGMKALAEAFAIISDAN